METNVLSIFLLNLTHWKKFYENFFWPWRGPLFLKPLFEKKTFFLVLDKNYKNFHIKWFFRVNPKKSTFQSDLIRTFFLLKKVFFFSKKKNLGLVNWSIKPWFSKFLILVIRSEINSHFQVQPILMPRQRPENYLELFGKKFDFLTKYW